MKSLLLASVFVLTAASAHAAVVFTDSSTIGGNAVTASATFVISGNALTLTLRNTSPAAGLETPTNTLSGLSFKLNGLDPTLTPVSALSPNAIFDAAGCTIHACGGTNVNVGGEWGYQTGFTGGTEAVGSAGYIATGLSGNLGNFNGINLTPPPSGSLDGIEMGIISNTVGPLNGGLTGQALIQDTVVLELTGVSGFTESQIGSVSFLYGTKPDATIPGTPGGVTRSVIPEPASLFLLSSSLLGLAVLRRRHSWLGAASGRPSLLTADAGLIAARR
jgi:hypothetical protein